MNRKLRPASLAIALASTFTLAAPAASVAAAVTSCADDGAGSLRAAIGAAASGATVSFDLASMQCSTITLTTGALLVNAADLTIAGPGADALTLDAGFASRVIDHEAAGTLTVRGLTITQGLVHLAAKSYGGCLYSHGSVIVDHARLDACVAYSVAEYTTALGGGIYAKGLVDLRFSTVSRSSATPMRNSSGSGGVGGAAYSATGLAVTNSTLSGNGANAGGALFTAGTLSVVNSTISGNTAGICAGILTPSYTVAGPVTTISNSTIAFNQASYAAFYGAPYAAGLCTSGSLTIDSSIVAGNDQYMDGGPAPVALDFSAKSGSTIGGAHNLIVASASGTTPPPGTLGADPKLLPLAENGGPTQTHELDVGSPAFASGSNPLRLGADQRGSGFARVSGTKTDIGAWQSGNGIFASGFD